MSPQLHLSRGFESPQLPSGDFSGDFSALKSDRGGSAEFESPQVRKQAKIASFCHFHPPVREKFFTKPDLEIRNFFDVKFSIFASKNNFSPVFTGEKLRASFLSTQRGGEGGIRTPETL